MSPARAAVATLTGLAVLALGSCSSSPDRVTTSTSTAAASTTHAGRGSSTTGGPGPTATTTATTTSSTTTTGPPAFAWEARPIDAALAARMAPSWRPGCPVPLEDLRYVALSYWGFDGAPHRGELVVHADAVDALRSAFSALFDQRFPIRSMRLVDDFGGDDDRSMAEDNTSAFNCRPVAGSSHWSQHAYGRAVDINPLENPYLHGGVVDPPAGSAFTDRSDVRPGMLVDASPAVGAFTGVGWGWGGSWRSPDYQHVSQDGS